MVCQCIDKCLSEVQDMDADTIDTGGITLGSLFFFDYKVAHPEKYPFWDIQPLAVALRFDRDGFLGCNLHYINPDYRDAVAESSLLNSGGGSVVPKNSIHKYLFSGMGTLYKVPDDEDWGSLLYSLQKDLSTNQVDHTLRNEHLTGENNNHEFLYMAESTLFPSQIPNE